MANELDKYKILSNHLVKTGFMDLYDELVDKIIIHNVEKIEDKLIFYTNIDTIEVPIASTLNELDNVIIDGATSGDILVYDGSNWVSQSQDTALEYIRTEDSYRFSDIKSSDLTSVISALDAILYPYKTPSFSSFSILSQDTTLEYGQELIPAIGKIVTFGWDTSNLENISDNGYTILDVTGSTILATGIPKADITRAVSIMYRIAYTTTTSHVFQIFTQSTKNITFYRNFSVNWRPNMYWGVSSDTSLTSATVRNLASSNLTTSAIGTYTMNGDGKYIYFVCPSSFGALIEEDGSGSKFLVGNLQNSAFIRTTLNYTNTYNHTETYYVYRSTTVQYGSSIEIKIT